MTFTLTPPMDLHMMSFAEAHKKIKGYEFYILVCHVLNKARAEYIRHAYKDRDIQVELVYLHEGKNSEWFVHGMKNYGPPFIFGTVHSNMPD